MSGQRLGKLATYYSFGDLLILPNASGIEPIEADISSRFTKKIALHLPIVSSPMDTVTESEMALEMARLGGIGVIHRNMSEAREVEEVRRVKSSKSGVETIDGEGRPAVAAAVGPFDAARAKALDSAGADVIVIDTAHGHNMNVVRSAKEI
ncbi:MAG TPA: IMP dehydrogenase, partial [Thermoproteota archaeon]|nr:IMP dehydrogenase [Thermoproteota archaeon]